jgi:hypothetical protein
MRPSVVLFAWTTLAVAADRPFVLAGRIAADDFSHGTANWTAELEKGGSITAKDGVLDVDVPGGLSLWWKQELRGPIFIRYEATMVQAAGANDRVSDLNCFWMATDARSPGDFFAARRLGRFADYNELRAYYVGQGGNTNTTTRFRRYVGDAELRTHRRPSNWWRWAAASSTTATAGCCSTTRIASLTRAAISRCARSRATFRFATSRCTGSRKPGGWSG